MSLYRCATALAGLLALALAACEVPPGLGLRRAPEATPHAAGAAETASTFEVLFTPSAAASGGAAIQVVHLAFDVARASFALDEVRDVRKIWNHVDELRIDPATAVQLARNGFRIGVGSPGGREAIYAILNTGKVDIAEERLFAQANLPLTIPIAPVIEGEPIFAYEHGNRLSGKTFEGGEKLLNIEYDVRSELARSVDLRLTFEIRRDLGVMTWERVDGAVREVPAYNRHMFEELRPVVTLSPGEFLVIGLAESASHPYLVGSRFLVAERGGKKYETLLFVTPRTSQSAGPAHHP